MDVPTPAASAEKSLESDMAEDICKLLEQTMLRYFPQTENDAGQPKPSSVPLVPHRQAKPQISRAIFPEAVRLPLFRAALPP